MIRLIPCLQMMNGSLVKTRKFKKPKYIGDPVNTCRIFNELEVDELCLLDIRATTDGYLIDYDLLEEIASECFMPLSYGGGIGSVEQAKIILELGFEKIIIGSELYHNPDLVQGLAQVIGSQSIVAAIDVKRTFRGYRVFIESGTTNARLKLEEWIPYLIDLGIGEILLTSINKEGTWNGFNLDLVRIVCDISTVPVIVHGGCGSVQDIKDVMRYNIGGVGLGNLVVYQKKGCGVLVNFPSGMD